MRTREIPAEQWHLFFHHFSSRHEGKHVNVETMDSHAVGLLARLKNLPLVSVVCTQKPDRPEAWIEIIAGHTPERHSTHSIGQPSRVCVAEEDDGQVVALQVESTDGNVTMLRFEPSHENLPRGFFIAQPSHYEVTHGSTHDTRGTMD